MAVSYSAWDWFDAKMNPGPHEQGSQHTAGHAGHESIESSAVTLRARCREEGLLGAGSRRVRGCFSKGAGRISSLAVVRTLALLLFGRLASLGGVEDDVDAVDLGAARGVAAEAVVGIRVAQLVSLCARGCMW